LGGLLSIGGKGKVIGDPGFLQHLGWRGCVDENTVRNPQHHDLGLSRIHAAVLAE
jgi:hypothetical protein